MSLAMPLSLGQRLVRERLRLHWSQEEVAQALGTTARSVNRWEHDKAVPHPHYRQQLCHVFHVSRESLFGPFPSVENTPSASSSLWTIPYRRNPFFTGREAMLLKLYTLLHSGKTATLAQAQAISGLGGIGKTQLALEYAYRFREEYATVLWVQAETRASLVAEFVTLATRLNLSEKDEQDQTRIVEAVKHWLATTNSWLLILDNVEDFTMVEDFLSSHVQGHIVFTTRTQSTGTFARCIDLEHMTIDEGTLFLLRRAKLLEYNACLEDASETLRCDARTIAHLMDGIPLALDQAGAYIEECGCSLSDYKDRYQAQRTYLLERRGSSTKDHTHSISTTLSLCFEKVEHVNPAATELLCLCAFLAADAIPEEIFTLGAAELGPTLLPLASNSLAFDDAIALLRRYSLLRRHPETKMLSIHRLVQTVLKDKMEKNMQYVWAERAVRIVNRAFPDVQGLGNWSLCQRYLAQAQACITLIGQWNMVSFETARLLHQTGAYLSQRAHYSQAEQLLKEALTMRMHLSGPEHLDVTPILDNLSELYYLQGQYTSMEPVTQKSLAIRKQHLGGEHPDVAESLNNLALLYFDQGRYAQAEPLHQQSLAIRKQTLGSEHPTVAESLNNLALLYRDWGKYAQAELLFPQALVTYEKALGPDHLYVALCLNNFAMLYRSQGQYIQAEPLYQRALTIREKVLGLEHPEVANTLSNLAVLYRHQGKYAQAEPLCQRALAIREKMLGMKHIDVALSLNSLSNIFIEQGRYDEAEPLCQRALAIREEGLGPEHLRTAQSLNDVARLYLKQGRYNEAEPLYQRALTIRTHQLGREHPDTIVTLESYTDLLVQMEKEARVVENPQQTV